MTNHWVDIKNANVVMVMGGNAAEAHPVGFRWAMEAKNNNDATLIVVDPRFTRTASVADIYAPIRSGTDITFLSGVLRYLIENNKINAEYVKHYTNASLLVRDDFAFEDGLFSGYDAEKRQYDKSSWNYQFDENGYAKRDETLTHRNMLANLEQVNATYGPLLHPGKELVVTALPLYHIFALTINCLLFIELGGQNLLITNPRDIPGLVKELAKYPFTAITGVNTLFNALLNNKEFQQLDFSSLHLSAGGGMPVQQVVAERWVKLTGQYLLEGYGLTECAPLVSVNPYDIDYHSGSIGLPVPSTEAKLVDDDDNEVPPGQPGELCVKGPQVMLGYWQRPDATDEIIKNGWLHTGDIAVMDEEGFLRIVDRKKDMILVSGFNVYPNEIEDVVMQHPGVQEVAAVGVPSGSSGEAVKIFVVKKDPSLTEESLVTFCRRQLTGYKVPKRVEFRDELPKSNVGKILRRELRDEARGKVDNKA